MVLGPGWRVESGEWRVERVEKNVCSYKTNPLSFRQAGEISPSPLSLSLSPRELISIVSFYYFEK
jgi:hypothetical protein